MAQCLAALLALCGPAEASCPDILTAEIGGPALACELLDSGRLVSSQGNGDVVYRLYRWVSSDDEPPYLVNDQPPYNQVAVTVSLGSGDPFWAWHIWLGIGWIEAPILVHNRRYGEMLVVPGRYSGTGSGIEDHVLLPTVARGWQPIDAAQMDAERAEGWRTALAARLPENHFITKGIRIDYETLTGESHVWKREDANCCPSGGRITFRLAIAGPDLRLVVQEAEYHRR